MRGYTHHPLVIQMRTYRWCWSRLGEDQAFLGVTAEYLVIAGGIQLTQCVLGGRAITIVITPMRLLSNEMRSNNNSSSQRNLITGACTIRPIGKSRNYLKPRRSCFGPAQLSLQRHRFPSTMS